MSQCCLKSLETCQEEPRGPSSAILNPPMAPAPPLSPASPRVVGVPGWTASLRTRVAALTPVPQNAIFPGNRDFTEGIKLK